MQINYSLVLFTKGTERASCAETNLGGTLQLLVDLKFLAGAFSPLVKAPHEASISACRQSIMDQAVTLAKGQGEREDPLAERLEEWLTSCEVSCRLPACLTARRAVDVPVLLGMKVCHEH